MTGLQLGNHHARGEALCTRAAMVLAAIVSMSVTATGRDPVPTTLEDFFQRGSQPTSGVVYDTFRPGVVCATCHDSRQGEELVIHAPWQGSMMAHAARDPFFLAALTVANQDADFAGDLCIRCHSPGGWVSGRSEPTDGSALTSIDRDGVNCSVCHRLVDPVFDPLTSPSADRGILDDIDALPVRPGGGGYIFDPLERFRGPYDDTGVVGHAVAATPYIRSSALCGTCHDISNPAYERQPDGTYVLTELDTAHPTGDIYDMFPVERTYSEWLNSEFARGGVDMQGRFGGNQSVVSTCQDCHMPKVQGYGGSIFSDPLRHDLASHDLAGGNVWMLDMILNMFPDDGLNPAHIEEGKRRATSMLTRASSLELTQHGNRVNVRVYNETGHKLPTGYPEGRRVWINVEVLDEGLSLIGEHGYYNPLTADLSTEDTKVYEAELGIDAAIALATGIPAGKGFHFALNNVILKDNRIPPRGFVNEVARTTQIAPVGTAYTDGQFWDDTRYRLPIGARFVTVRLMYQTASKEYITFLRDENHTDNTGNDLYLNWELTGMSPPVLMAEASITVAPFATGDFDGDMRIDLDDFFAFQAECMTGVDLDYSDSNCVSLDFDADGDVDFEDFREFEISVTD